MKPKARAQRLTAGDGARALRIGGWAGIVFAILSLIIIPFALPPAPQLGAGSHAFAVWYRDHRLGFLVGNYLGIAAFFPGFIQLSILTARVRRFEGADGWRSWLVFSCAIFAYTMFAGGLVVFQVLPFLAELRLEIATEMLGSLALIWFALSGLAAIPLLLAVGWATVVTRALPKWLAPASWLCALVTFMMSLGSLTRMPSWLAAGGPVTAVGFVAFFVWIAAISVTFLSLAKSVT